MSISRKSSNVATARGSLVDCGSAGRELRGRRRPRAPARARACGHRWRSRRGGLPSTLGGVAGRAGSGVAAAAPGPAAPRRWAGSARRRTPGCVEHLLVARREHDRRAVLLDRSGGVRGAIAAGSSSAVARRGGERPPAWSSTTRARRLLAASRPRRPSAPGAAAAGCAAAGTAAGGRGRPARRGVGLGVGHVLDLDGAGGDDHRRGHARRRPSWRAWTRRPTRRRPR